MSRRKASLEGVGRTILGRGVDLLFGEQEPAQVRRDAPAAEADAAISQEELAHVFDDQAPPEGEAPATSPGTNGHTEDDSYLRAEADAPTVTRPSPGGGHKAPVDEGPQLVTDLGGIDLELDLPPVPPADESDAVTGQALGEVGLPSPQAAGDETTQPANESAAATEVPAVEPSSVPDETAAAEAGPPAEEVESSLQPPLPTGADLAHPEGESAPSAAIQPPLPDLPATGDAAMAAPPSSQPTPPSAEPAEGQSPSSEEAIMPEQPSKPQELVKPSANGADAGGEAAEAQRADEEAVKEARAVGVPGEEPVAPITIVIPERREYTEEEREAIMKRVTAGRLRKLTDEIDDLYEKLPTVLSDNHGLAKQAYDSLLEARRIMLEQPVQYANAENLVRQVKALLIRIERSDEQAEKYSTRLFLYELAWLVLFGFVAWFATVPDNPYARMIGNWIGSGTPLTAQVSDMIAGVATAASDAAAVAASAAGDAVDATAAATAAANAVAQAAAAEVEVVTAAITQANEGFAWAMLLLSTLAWGGVGGVASALWSLRHHVTVARDYQRVDNLWYYEQPVMGMVLGGIVYLITAAGFLVVNASVAGPDASLGAKLLPAAIAVIFGFRQAVVLDLIDRAVKLVSPAAEPGEEAS